MRLGTCSPTSQSPSFPVGTPTSLGGVPTGRKTEQLPTKNYALDSQNLEKRLFVNEEVATKLDEMWTWMWKFEDLYPVVLVFHLSTRESLGPHERMGELYDFFLTYSENLMIHHGESDVGLTPSKGDLVRFLNRTHVSTEVGGDDDLYVEKEIGSFVFGMAFKNGPKPPHQIAIDMYDTSMHVCFEDVNMFNKEDVVGFVHVFCEVHKLFDDVLFEYYIRLSEIGDEEDFLGQRVADICHAYYHESKLWHQSKSMVL